jgi:hypothetical protein
MSSLDAYYEGGPRTWNEAFPPICLRSHWDPTALAKHVLPSLPNRTVLPLDPRQATKICYGYYHTSLGDPNTTINKDDVMLPVPDALLGSKWESAPITASTVMPPGGAARTGFPFANYASSVNDESKLQLLNLPQSKCADKKYIPPNARPSEDIATNDVPGSAKGGLSPLATFVQQTTGCRAADDSAAWDRSARLFFNPTKYDRTLRVPPGTREAESNNTLRCPQ